jgi:hypothetical protein
MPSSSEKNNIMVKESRNAVLNARIQPLESEKKTLSAKTEQLIACWEQQGMPEGMGSYNIDESGNIFRFGDNPLRFFHQKEQIFFSAVDIYSILQPVPFQDHLLQVVAFNDWSLKLPNLRNQIVYFAWRPTPKSRFFRNIQCLDTEGVLFLLEQVKTDQTEAFKKWFSEISTEQISV